jgi:acetyl-CoA carboxylase carboxyl transferase subunit beta
MSNWFKRVRRGVTTSTKEKKEAPEGLWYKCPSCKTIVPVSDHAANQYVCNNCGYHERIGSKEYFSVIFDDNNYTEINEGLRAEDPLKFKDTKQYTDRLKESITKTNLNDAIATAYGRVDGEALMVACMDFSFIGGSMGSGVGAR